MKKIERLIIQFEISHKIAGDGTTIKSGLALKKTCQELVLQFNNFNNNKSTASKKKIEIEKLIINAFYDGIYFEPNNKLTYDEIKKLREKKIKNIIESEQKNIKKILK